MLQSRTATRLAGRRQRSHVGSSCVGWYLPAPRTPHPAPARTLHPQPLPAPARTLRPPVPAVPARTRSPFPTPAPALPAA